MVEVLQSERPSRNCMFAASLAHVRMPAGTQLRPLRSRLSLAYTYTCNPASSAFARSFAASTASAFSAPFSWPSFRAAATNIPPAEPWRRHLSLEPQTPTVFTFFEKATSTWQYIVIDPKTADAVIIDPVLDYDPASGAVSTSTADGLISFVEHNNLKVTRIL